MWSTRHLGQRVRVLVYHKRHYRAPPPLLEDLTQRGFIQDVTRPDAFENALATKVQTIYAGVDPTAKSLHIGHLIPLMCLLHFQIRGHRIIPLIGGATGRVGDPSGRLVERQLADVKQVEDNVVNLTSSIQAFFKRAYLYAGSHVSLDSNVKPEPVVRSNLDWHGSFTLLDFLQAVGVHARVNTMLNRESVRARLTSQQGLSFTEFTYQLLQAYDFYYLHKHFGCSIQVGGSDQWGNIVAGLELIGKMDPSHPNQGPSNASGVYGFTTPLLTTSTGEKFGKSAGNAVWLDSSLTSIFDFYQYFLKVTDTDVGKYLRMFTFMSMKEINELVQEHMKEPEKRRAQLRLAAEVTEMVHLKQGVKQAETMTKLMFGSDYLDLKASDVISSFKGDPRLVICSTEDITGIPVTKLAATYGLVSSNSVSRTLVASRGLYLNNQAIQDAQYKITPSNLLDNKFVILRAGKDKMLILLASN